MRSPTEYLDSLPSCDVIANLSVLILINRTWAFRRHAVDCDHFILLPVVSSSLPVLACTDLLSLVSTPDFLPLNFFFLTCVLSNTLLLIGLTCVPQPACINSNFSLLSAVRSFQVMFSFFFWFWAETCRSFKFFFGGEGNYCTIHICFWVLLLPEMWHNQIKTQPM